jgi:hypothetical protein
VTYITGNENWYYFPTLRQFAILRHAHARYSSSEIAPCQPEQGLMTKNSTEENAKGAPMKAKSKRSGWYLILAIALATAVFFVLGTIDTDLRYDLIGI